MALSTSEAEYVATCSARHEVVWLRKLLSDLFYLQLDTTCIYCDNQSCIKLSENPLFHDKSKHIEIKYHYIRDMVQRGAVKLQYVVTEEQIANVLTKPLSRVNLSNSGRSLVFSRSRFPRKGIDVSMSPSDMVRKFVPSMVRCKCRGILM